jgi:hypothetical protein
MEKNILEQSYSALSAKTKPYTDMMRYYDGDHPLRFSHERLKDAFGVGSVKFIQNWCAVVVDSVLDRLSFVGWDHADKKQNELLDAFYIANSIDVLSSDIHEKAITTSEAFIVFDKVDDVTRAFHNDPRLVHVFYNPENPNEKLAAAKWWKDIENKKTRLNVYYPDRIIKYEAKDAPSSYKAFKQTEEVDNPFKEVPVIRFSTKSELLNVVSIQDAVNKTFSDMMVVEEFNTFKQRWAVTNADLSNLKNSPRSFFQIPKGMSDEEGTKIGEFDAADLEKFLSTMDKLANVIAIISRTPKHYFMNTGSNISGEALVVMESPLLKKVDKVIKQFDRSWKDCARFILRHQSSKEVEANDVVTVWDPIETVQPLLKAQEMEVLKRLGIPLKTIMRRAGWGNDEIEQYEKDAKEEKSNKATETSLLLEQIRRRNQQENDQNERSGL